MSSRLSTADIDTTGAVASAWLSALGLSFLVLLALACGATETPANEVVLSRWIEANDASLELRSGNPVHPVEWDASGDSRQAIFQHPPSVVVLRKPLEGDRCTLHFGIGLQPEAWPESDGATFRVALETADGEVEIFEAFFDPSSHAGPRWIDHEIDLPPIEGRLVFETDPGPSGVAHKDWVAWASPRIDCRTAVGVSPAPPTPHIVLISLDTLRADRLGTYGYEKATSPEVDAFARASTVFDNAFAVAPFTLPSHASMFTGLYPDEHLAGHGSPFVPLHDEAFTLAERLRTRGYRTLAFTAGGIMSRRNGLAQGFDVWFEKTRIRFSAVLPRIFSELGADSSVPTFLFVHTYDIHGPYLDSARGPGSADDHRASSEWRRIRSIEAHRYLELDRFSNLEGVRDAYDEGIRRTDETLGLLFSHLRRLGMWEHALIIVTSDHGETLYDRNLYIGHTYTLHDEVVRIPLIVKLPGQTSGLRSDQLVDQTDLLPTVLASSGLGAESNVSGSDVFARIRGEAPKRERVRGEAAHSGARYARTKTWKAISAARALDDARSLVPQGIGDRFATGPQIFALNHDRDETENLASAPDLDPAARRLLTAATEAATPGERAGDAPLEDDVADQLRALGYVE